jgi:hypothetical protein
MSKRKPREPGDIIRYFNGTPPRLREGEILCHNRVAFNGFRYFVCDAGHGWKLCPCGWRPDFGSLDLPGGSCCVIVNQRANLTSDAACRCTETPAKPQCARRPSGLCQSQAGARLNRSHIVVGQAEMMPDLMHQHVGYDCSQGLLVLGPIVENLCEKHMPRLGGVPPGSPYDALATATPARAA